MYIFTFFICKYCIHVIIDPDRRNFSYMTDRLASRFVSVYLYTIYILSQIIINIRSCEASRTKLSNAVITQILIERLEYITSCISTSHFHLSKNS